MSVILRNSSIPAAFKFKVESTYKNVDVYNSTTRQMESKPIEIPLNTDPATHCNFSVDPFAVFFMTVACVMSSSQFKNKEKSCLVFNKDDSGEVIAACISDYDKEGDNYYYYFSYDPAEIKNVKNSINYTDFVMETNNADFGFLFNLEFEKHYLSAITNIEMFKGVCISILEVLYTFLDQNAKEGEVVEVIIDGWVQQYKVGIDDAEYNAGLRPVAIASVETNKDVKKMSIQFSEEFKAIAKGSSDII